MAAPREPWNSWLPTSPGANQRGSRRLGPPSARGAAHLQALEASQKFNAALDTYLDALKPTR
jgi:hypothetical protein